MSKPAIWVGPIPWSTSGNGEWHQCTFETRGYSDGSPTAKHPRLVQ